MFYFVCFRSLFKGQFTQKTHKDLKQLQRKLQYTGPSQFDSSRLTVRPADTAVDRGQFLCRGQTTRYFCPLKCSLCQMRRLKCQKFLLCCGRETWQTTRCSQSNHCLQFTTCMLSPARKRLLLTTTTDKLSWEVSKRIIVFLSRGREASSWWIPGWFKAALHFYHCAHALFPYPWTTRYDLENKHKEQLKCQKLMSDQSYLLNTNTPQEGKSGLQ